MTDNKSSKETTNTSVENSVVYSGGGKPIGEIVNGKYIPYTSTSGSASSSTSSSTTGSVRGFVDNYGYVWYRGKIIGRTTPAKSGQYVSEGEYIPAESVEEARNIVPPSEENPGGTKVKVAIGETESGEPVEREVYIEEVVGTYAREGKEGIAKRYGRKVAEKVEIKQKGDRYEVSYPVFLREKQPEQRPEQKPKEEKEAEPKSEQKPESEKKEPEKIEQKPSRLDAWKDLIMKPVSDAWRDLNIKERAPEILIHELPPQPKQVSSEEKLRKELEAKGFPLFPEEKMDIEEELLLFSLDVSDILTKGVEKITKPFGAIGGFARGGVSPITGAPAFVGTTAYSIEQIAKHHDVLFKTPPSIEEIKTESKRMLKQSWESMSTSEKLGAITAMTLLAFRASGGKIIGGEFGGRVPALKIESGKLGESRYAGLVIEKATPGYGGEGGVVEAKPVITIGGEEKISLLKAPRARIEGTIEAPKTAFETEIVKRSVTEEAGKIEYLREAKKYLVKSRYTPEEIKGQIKNVVESAEAGKGETAERIAGEIVKTSKKYEGEVYGSVVQKQVGEEIGVVALKRTPRDIDIHVKSPERFKTEVVERINKVAGKEIVGIEEGKVIVKKTGEKLFDIFSKEEMIKYGKKSKEGYIAYGLKEEAKGITKEGLKTISISEQTSRKASGAMAKVSGEVREVGEIKGEITPEHAGRVKDIADFYYGTKAEVEILKSKGMTAEAERANMAVEKWLREWGEDVVAKIKNTPSEAEVKVNLASFSKTSSLPSSSAIASSISGIGLVSELKSSPVIQEKSRSVSKIEKSEISRLIKSKPAKSKLTTSKVSSVLKGKSKPSSQIAKSKSREVSKVSKSLIYKMPKSIFSSSSTPSKASKPPSKLPSSILKSLTLRSKPISPVKTPKTPNHISSVINIKKQTKKKKPPIPLPDLRFREEKEKQKPQRFKKRYAKELIQPFFKVKIKGEKLIKQGR